MPKNAKKGIKEWEVLTIFSCRISKSLSLYYKNKILVLLVDQSNSFMESFTYT